MAYWLVYNQEIKRQIARLPGHIKSIARQRIAALSDDPRPARSKELAGHPGWFRLWLDRDYRLVWHIDEEAKIVELEYVGFKVPDLYEQLGLSRPVGDE